MATSTLLQYLQADDGSGTALGVSPSNRRQVERYVASAAIAKNDLVAFDFAKSTDGEIALTVRKADSGSAASICAVGFALEAAAAAGDEINVTVAGVHVSANVAGAVAKGDRLSISAVAGQADTYVNSDTVPIIGYAIEDDTANVASVMVIKQF